MNYMKLFACLMAYAVICIQGNSFNVAIFLSDIFEINIEHIFSEFLLLRNVISDISVLSIFFNFLIFWYPFNILKTFSYNLVRDLRQQ